MKRVVFFAAAQFALGTLWAQQKMVSTRVVSEPCGRFYVDGTLYTHAAGFLWPENSTHVLSIGLSYPIADGIQCEATGTSWVDSSGNTVPGGSTVVISASPAISSYQTDSKIEYLLTLIVSQGQMPLSCDQQHGPASGSVSVNGACYDQDTELWLSANSMVTLQAYPALGWVFWGWQPAPLGGLTTSVGSFVLQCPVNVTPRFDRATQVNLLTSPDALKLLADGAVLVSGATVYWATNSSHTISSVSPQMDQWGQVWVWDSWSQGGSETQVYKTSPYPGSITLTANYALGGRVSFGTSPAGLKLAIDGRDNWPSYTFVWRVGSTHTISAPLQQADAQGRQYTFNSWSTPGGADQQYTVTSTDQVGVVASYDILGRLTVRSTPGDINILVDGAACKTPCTIDRKSGTQVKVTAPATVSLTDTMRLDYQSWSDGGPRERTWTAGTDATTLMVNYQSSNLVQAVSDPAGGATFSFEPASTDGFYPANTDVTVTVTALLGYKFKGWEGDASGTSKSAHVNTSAPVFLTALLDRVPYVAPTGVRNAAGDGPGAVAVAPGSLISIYGGGLAPGFEQGPDSPLVQTLANVTVQVSDRLLPLLFVSPSQINAQLPSDLAEGQYKVVVRGDSQPDASARFTARRNAPGLFTRVVDGKQYALALHADGTLVTTDSPAAQDETVTLLGTGLGPYQEGGFDGFAIPAGMVLHLADAVQIQAGDKAITPSETVAAAGYVGITAIRFKIGDALPAATVVELKVAVNGYASNTALLPVR